MIQYFGRHPMKQYVRDKPIRFGFNEWTICSINGYIYEFNVYQSKYEVLNQ